MAVNTCIILSQMETGFGFVGSIFKKKDGKYQQGRISGAAFLIFQLRLLLSWLLVATVIRTKIS